jgi:hypothetical protein
MTGRLKTRLALAALPFLTVLPVALIVIGAPPERRVSIENARAIAKVITRAYDIDVARHLYGCPTVLLWLTLVTLNLTPTLTLAVAYDMVSADVRSGAIGMMLTRSSRLELMVGKAFAATAVFCAVLGVTHAMVWAVAIGRGYDSPLLMLKWGCLLLCATCGVGMANLAVWMLVSSLSRRPIVCFWVGFGVLSLLTGLHAEAHAKAPSWDGFTPVSVDGLLLSGQALRQWRGVGVIVAWYVACLLSAATCLRVRDLR